MQGALPRSHQSPHLGERKKEAYVPGSSVKPNNSEPTYEREFYIKFDGKPAYKVKITGRQTSAAIDISEAQGDEFRFIMKSLCEFPMHPKEAMLRAFELVATTSGELASR